MEITVAHMTRNNHTGTLSFSDVAIVTAPEGLSRMDALEYAFRWTNNLDGSWSLGEEFCIGGHLFDNPDYNKDVRVLSKRPDGLGLRSTSMFDRMTIDKTVYEVSGCGFEIVEERA
jgi:hypothetical protein